MSRFVLLIVLSIVLSRAFWRLVDGVIAGMAAGPREGGRKSHAAMHMHRDPVCGTFVASDTALVLSEGPRQVYFCSASCRDAYRARTA